MVATALPRITEGREAHITEEGMEADNMDSQSIEQPASQLVDLTGEPVVLTMTVAEFAGQPVLIPGGAWFLRAEFSREGADLVLTGTEGQNVIIKDYFEAGEPPALTTENGLTLKGHVVVSLVGPFAPGQYADVADGLDSLALLGEPIGTIETLSGTVEVTRADGTREILNPGDLVYQGDFVETSADGSMGVVFLDESTFSLGQNGRITFDEMVYSPEAQSGTATMTLLQGTFSFVSGALARTDPDAVVIDTPTATIGIRGTGGGGNVGADGNLTIAILEEIGGVTGEVVVFNDQGTTIINQPNTGVTVEPGVAPTVPVAFSSQQLGQVFGTTLLDLPNVAEAFTPETLTEIRAGIPGAAGAEDEQDQFASVIAVEEEHDDGQMQESLMVPEATLDTSDDTPGDLAALAEAANNRVQELIDDIQDYIATFTFRHDSLLDGEDIITGLDVDFQMEINRDAFQEVTETNFQAGGSVVEEGLEQPVKWLYSEDSFNNGQDVVTTDGESHDADLTAEQLTAFTSDEDDQLPPTDTGMG